MSETQETVGKWISETFPGNNPDSPRMAIRALEEMIELCFVSGASIEDIYKAVVKVGNKEWANIPLLDRFTVARRVPDKVPAEVADVFIVLYGLAHEGGFNIQKEVDNKMVVNRARKWIANGDGTGYHVKQNKPITRVFFKGGEYMDFTDPEEAKIYDTQPDYDRTETIR